MGKNQSASGLTNIVQYDTAGNISLVSGSTTLLYISSSGAIITTGVISGSNALSASYSISASNALAAQTASYVQNAQSASYVLTAQTASFVLNAQSASNAVAAQTASYANNLTVAGTLTAQTLVVQTITSSVDFVTGSTRFGSLLTNTHVFSGSVTMNPNGLFVSGSGLVGIGITTPIRPLHVNASSDTRIVITDSNVSTTNGLYIRQFGSASAIVNNNNGTFQLGTNDTYFLTANTSGQVGIGNTQPNSTLHVRGDNGNSVSSVLRIRDTNSTARTTRLQFEDYNGTLADGIIDFKIPTAGSAVGARLDIGVDGAIISLVRGGLVGIGTTDPGQTLEVRSSDGQGIRFKNAGSSDKRWDFVGSGNDFRVNETGVGAVMTFEAGGYVGIGTTNPAQSLEVNGNILASSTGKIGFRYSSGDGNYYSYLRSGTSGSIGPIILGGGFESGGATNEAIRFVTNANPGERNAVSILNSGRVGIGTTGPTTTLQIRKNYWQFWDEKSHGSNADLFSVTIPHFGAAIVTIAGSKFSPGADNYQGISTFYIFITNVGAVSVNGGTNFGTWSVSTSISSKTVTFTSTYAGSSTNYTSYSAVIQASGHNNGSESAAYVTIL
jgi:hypothetical protein